MRKMLLAILLIGCGGSGGPPLDGAWTGGDGWLVLGDGGDYQRPFDHGRWTSAGGELRLASDCDDRVVVHGVALDGDALRIGGVVYRRTAGESTWVSVCR